MLWYAFQEHRTLLSFGYVSVAVLFIPSDILTAGRSSRLDSLARRDLPQRIAARECPASMPDNSIIEKIVLGFLRLLMPPFRNEPYRPTLAAKDALRMGHPMQSFRAGSIDMTSSHLSDRRQFNVGAEEGTRTPTPLRVHGPEPCASANSATSALMRSPARERRTSSSSYFYKDATCCQLAGTSWPRIPARGDRPSRYYLQSQNS